MKKWAPYKSLVEQEEYIHKMRKDRNKISKPVLSSDEAERINDILVHYHGEELTIDVFSDGEIYQIVSALKGIDTVNRRLILTNNTYIYLKDLVNLK